MADKPIDPQRMRKIEYYTREIGTLISQAINPTGKKVIGFALMIFSFDGSEFSWISNADRADMVKTMQEFIKRNPPDQTSEGRN
jgi:hypothetical protein